MRSGGAAIETHARVNRTVETACSRSFAARRQRRPSERKPLHTAPIAVATRAGWAAPHSPAPSTVRPSLELGQAVDRMRRQNLTTLPVTRSDGVLVGVLRRDDAEQALGRLS